MDLGLKSRVALVTGASRGIGYSIANSLAAEGCNLHVAAREEAGIEEAARQLAAEHGVKVTPHVHDLSSPAAVEQLAKNCAGVDILVNNAGAIPKGYFEKTADVPMRASWDLKLFGYLNLARPLYSEMCARGHGVIVNIIGIAGERPPFDGIAGASLMPPLSHSPRHSARTV